MIGIALGTALWWSVRPVRLRWSEVRADPASLVVPGVLVAATAYRVSEAAGLAAFALLVPATALLGTLRRRPVGDEGEGPPRSLRTSALLLVGLVTWLSFRDVVGGGGAGRAIVAVAATAVLLGSIVRSHRPGGVDVRVAVWSATCFLAAALVQAGITGDEWVACSETFDKCTPVGQLYRGPFPSENTLAFAAALVAMAALQLRGTPRFRTLLALLATIVLLTGSRTSAVALVAAGPGAAALGATAVRRTRGGFRLDRAVGSAITALITGGGLWLVFHAAPGSFSLRGTVWAQARTVVSPTTLWGQGRGRYQALLDQGWFRGHYPHSQYLLLQFFGGLIAVALFVALMVALLATVRSPTRWQAGAGAAPIVFALAFGLTEVAWNPLGMAPDLWPMLVVFAAVPLEARPPDRVLAESAAETVP